MRGKENMLTFFFQNIILFLEYQSIECLFGEERFWVEIRNGTWLHIHNQMSLKYPTKIIRNMDIEIRNSSISKDTNPWRSKIWRLSLLQYPSPSDKHKSSQSPNNNILVLWWRTCKTFTEIRLKSYFEFVIKWAKFYKNKPQKSSTVDFILRDSRYANSNQSRFPMVFRLTFTVILPSATRTLDYSNLPLTRSNFCFPSAHFCTILSLITRTML